MSVLSFEELRNSLKTFIGENNSDEALALIENTEDTITNYENMIADKTDWKQKFEENDKAWRERYKARFYSGTDPKEKKDEASGEKSDDNKNYTFDNLFNGGK